jgi:hypothetical protein
MQSVCMNQQAIELDAIDELAQGRDLVAVIGGVGVMDDRYPKGVGVQAHLSDKNARRQRRFYRSNPAGSCRLSPACRRTR